MKKIGVVAAGILISSFAISHTGLALDKPVELSQIANDEQPKEMESTQFIIFSGAVEKIEIDGKTTRFHVKNDQEGLEMIFPVKDEVLFFNSANGDRLEASAIKEGTKVDVFYDKNKPMPLIYPATITPDFIMVQSENLGFVKVAKFDDKFISLDNELKLHISDDTPLMNEKGETLVKDELAGKELIVFYSETTRSIPAQTMPKKIIALQFTDERLKEIHQIIDEDHYFKGDIKMIPLRKAAEHLGYKVEKKKNQIYLKLQNSTFQLSIGDKVYGYNRSIGQLRTAPEMKNGKTYVSDEFVEELLK
ncbi:copper amine oxidase N-terminal domain-containing protein [Bacillus sp. S/N-304-OC-R1]|uniref:copper amine oxidase N-terminal domain-containing protein n=1 Tax=Bacillus sp. S/N-304-OC-R1 TaxID=2758034 RepID=UPI001C8E4348|nr:copper amine oxidase N-terminal domain-containing protein [Bacillus sp. S/N-304-OC-R1]MBY0123686.1 copper amine oxidase N-terminal domain-containing protein [Bacillus sp. S/N-304-OC-R1]